MTLFKKWKKQKLVLSEVEPTYRVKYLGNVQTGFMKGEGCVDKPVGVLWANYTKNGPQSVGLDMTLTICGSGMKAVTKEQGLTEYRAHRISYCVAHPAFRRLFVWVYRHEGKKMKVELRCHAVLCSSEAKAKLMAVQLHDKLSFALGEFLREKTRRQTSRLALQRANALSAAAASGSGGVTYVISGAALRNKFLSTAQNFKPSVQNLAGAPKLGAITENTEEEEEEEEVEEMVMEELDGEEKETVSGEEDIRPGPVLMNTHPSMASLQGSDQTGSEHASDLDLQNGVYDLVIGNDIEQLKRELSESRADDSDAESSESGFSEQDGVTSGQNRNGAGVVEPMENGRNLSNNNSVAFVEQSPASVNRSKGRNVDEQIDDTFNTEDAMTAL